MALSIAVIRGFSVDECCTGSGSLRLQIRHRGLGLRLVWAFKVPITEFKSRSATLKSSYIHIHFFQSRSVFSFDKMSSEDDVILVAVIGLIVDSCINMYTKKHFWIRQTLKNQNIYNVSDLIKD